MPAYVESKWRHGEVSNPDMKYAWNGDLVPAATSAIWIASNFDGFRAAYPAWHKDYYSAELVDENTVRFEAAVDVQERRVSAFQKGIRPAGALPIPNLGPQSDVGVQGILEILERALKKAERQGDLGIRYKISTAAFDAHSDWYSKRLDGQFRRYDSTDLGPYTLGAARKFYASLRALCDAHQYICDGWADRRGVYPLDSAVIVKNVQDWISFFAKATRLSRDVTAAILRDLTMGT